jgi:hypothetical protein
VTARSSTNPRETQRDHDLLIELTSNSRQMQQDLSEIKSDVKESKAHYATKDELNFQSKRIDRIMGYGGAVLLILTGILLTAFLHFVGPAL